MSIEYLFISPFLIVFSLGMLVTSLMSYRRSKNLKLLFVSVVFLFFLSKGVLLMVSLFNSDVARVTTLSSFSVIDVIILVFLFIATLKR
jgi:hypothetical protein